jgi:hypothetical protein
MMSACKLIVRGFGDGALVFEDDLEIIDEASMDRIMKRLIKTHITALARSYEVHMLEFEFPDAPEHERFLRFGTDPRGMVMPIEMHL